VWNFLGAHTRDEPFPAASRLSGLTAPTSVFRGSTLSCVNAEHLSLLKRQAATRPTDSTGLMLKAKALDELVRQLDVTSSPSALEAIRKELLGVIAAAEVLGTARAQAVSTMAGRLLSLLDDRVERDDLEWPSTTPDEPAGRDYWHPTPEFAERDGGDTQGQRDQWRARLLGPPPWRPGQVVPTVDTDTLELPDDDDFEAA
jgi:hypothetical protein